MRDSEAVPQVQAWVNHFLRPRTFDIGVNGRIFGPVAMTQGAPQDSPLSPALFSIYMSQVVLEGEGAIREKDDTDHRNLRLGKGKTVLKPFFYIDDVNSEAVQ